jgi:hypothetical protein
MGQKKKSWTPHQEMGWRLPKAPTHETQEKGKKTKQCDKKRKRNKKDPDRPPVTRLDIDTDRLDEKLCVAETLPL